MLLLAKNIITGDGKTVIKDAAVLLKDNKIIEVGTAKELKQNYENSETIIDYKDATILPGLFDMHVHFGYYYSQTDLQNYDDFMIAYYALKQASFALELGITTVRDASSSKNLCKDLKLATEKGYVKAPRIIHSDTGMCISGGHGHVDGIEEVDGVDNIRSAIRRQLRDGAEWIKVLTSHRTHTSEYTQEELDAAVDECHRRNIKCFVHAGTHPSIEMSIKAGFDTIEHGTFLTVELAKEMAKNNQAWTPTITAYTYLYEYCCEVLEKNLDTSNPVAAAAKRDKDYFEAAAKAYENNFKALYDTGVTVLAGSDMVLLGAPPLPINKELYYMVKYGITPIEAIKTATVNPSKVLGLDEVTGQVKKGLEADLLVVKGDVARDITCLNDVLEVYLAGESVHKI